MSNKTIDERPVDTDPIDTNLSTVKKQVTDVHNSLVEIIGKTFDRGDKIEILVDKSTNLSSRADAFRNTTTNLKRRMLIRNLKLWGMIALIVLIVIAFIVLLICVSGSC